MADKKIICPQCRSSILAEWKEANWSMVYSFKCPACGTDLHVTGAPPIQIHGMDATGNWRFVQTIGGTPME
jgi:DNA-directed RNA polymerase subunit RPC12/RpoP